MRKVQPLKREPITAIKFAVQVPKFAESGTYQRTEVEKVVFKLGLGPCNETVEFLGASESIGWVTICQRTEKGTKDFKYRVQDIVGRVVVERAEI